ncbi:type II toxin-antitoxin system RelE/ParE family toxin [Roseburia hominis]
MAIRIQYHDNTVKKLCTDLKKAKKEMPVSVAEKLHALINLIESSVNLQDIANMQIYHLHPLHGDREGLYALDIAGRRVGYRLIVIPLDLNGKKWKEKDVNVVYKSTEIIVAWEVSNHYE